MGVCLEVMQPRLPSQDSGVPALSIFWCPPVFMPTLFNAERQNSEWYLVTHNMGRGVLGGQPRHCIFTNTSRGLSATDEFLVLLVIRITLQLPCLCCLTALVNSFFLYCRSFSNDFHSHFQLKFHCSTILSPIYLTNNFNNAQVSIDQIGYFPKLTRSFKHKVHRAASVVESF